MNVYISCVEKGLSHPSSVLVTKFETEGFYTLNLFSNSRSLFSSFRDFIKLYNYFSLNKNEYINLVSNVNGSLSRFIIIILCRFFSINKSTFYIMDVYPGSLKFLTNKWWLYYPLFSFMEYISLLLVDKVIVIDEGFLNLYPLKLFQNKIVIQRLKFNQPVLPKKNGNFVGIIGNVSNDFLSKNSTLILKTKSIGNLVLASSNDLPKWLIDASNVSFIPWEKKDTNVVFNMMKFNLICADYERLLYCSPSKIIDSYMRGIIPIIFVNDDQYRILKNRDIYKYCFTIHYFLSSTDQLLSLNTSDIVKHGSRWICNDFDT